MPFPLGSGFLRCVACPTATSCLAVGAGTMTARWDGATWSSVPIADPGVPVNLVSVACSTNTSCSLVGSKLGATTCVAVGRTAESSPPNRQLLKVLTGTHWSIMPGSRARTAPTSTPCRA